MCISGMINEHHYRTAMVEMSCDFIRTSFGVSLITSWGVALLIQGVAEDDHALCSIVNIFIILHDVVI